MQHSAQSRHKRMTEAPIPGLIVKLAIPTIVSMLVSAVYNMADTYFVSQLGTSAAGAVGVVFSLMALIQAAGFTLGMGAGNNISRLLGARAGEEANRFASTAFFGALLIGALMAVAGLLLLDPMVALLGATETIAPHARDYAGYILIGAPYMAASYVLNNILRAQGLAALSMIGISVGGLLNIALDPIFIFVLDMGTGGAALATIISQLVSFVLLLYLLHRHGEVKLSLKHVSLRRTVLGKLLYTGMPSFWRQALASLAMIALNRFSGIYTGALADQTIAAMSIVSRAMWFVTSALIGFGQGFQPVCGFNYGARRYDRVREAFWFCVKVAVVGLAISGAALFALAEPLLIAFRPDDPKAVEIGILALRMQCAVLPLQAWVVMCNMSYQSIGDGGRASILAVARQGLCFIPIVALLPIWLGVLGIQLSQPLADVATFLIALPLGARFVRHMNALWHAEQMGGGEKAAPAPVPAALWSESPD